MVKRYDYEDRTILQFENKKRVNYNHKKYGPLLEDVIKQASDSQEKIWQPYKIIDDSVEIYYWYQREEEIKTFLVDEKDFLRVKNFYWQLFGIDYPHVLTRKDGEKKWLHNYIMNFDNKKYPKYVVDHIDRNPLNNKKDNLRIISTQRNQWNQEKNKDTGIKKRNNRWRVTGSAILKQETNVDSYEEALRIREQYVKEIECYLDEIDMKNKKFNDYPVREYTISD